MSGFALFFHGFCVDGTHIMKAVRKFYDDYSNVFRHSDHHFSDVFRLSFLFGNKFDLAEFGNAVDHCRNVIAEFFSDLFESNRGILNHVVKKRRTYSIGIHTELNNSKRRSDRMDDIRFSGGAFLFKVCASGKGVGPLYFLNVISFVDIYRIFKFRKIFGHYFFTAYLSEKIFQMFPLLSFSRSFESSIFIF